MGRNALRRIHEFLEGSGRYPTLDELETWISEHCRRALDHLSASDFEKKVQDSAIFALDKYDPEVWEAFARRGANGGKMSGHKKGARGKRPPTHKPGDLDGLEELSKTEQAARLGCSVATVGRLRAERARMQEQPDFLEQVMADIDAESVAANPAAAKKPMDVAANSVAANNPIIDIATRKPIDPLEQALLDYEDEHKKRVDENRANFLQTMGL
ncbi:hypothetical protein AB0870_09880 [Microbacterium proteolyticum]|uniref:hypothetical protein n=1 Tax=Microbacterium proteolyticum TaxID=1572644 RepID=UPI002415FEAC|nr:hypothetical protein [Microbacterium proteolyticum]